MIFGTNKLHKAANEMLLTLSRLLFARGRYKLGRFLSAL